MTNVTISYGSAESQSANISEDIAQIIRGRDTTRVSWMPKGYQAGLYCRTIKR